MFRAEGGAVGDLCEGAGAGCVCYGGFDAHFTGGAFLVEQVGRWVILASVEYVWLSVDSILCLRFVWFVCWPLVRFSFCRESIYAPALFYRVESMQSTHYLHGLIYMFIHSTWFPDCLFLVKYDPQSQIILSISLSRLA